MAKERDLAEVANRTAQALRRLGRTLNGVGMEGGTEIKIAGLLDELATEIRRLRDTSVSESSAVR
jgi:hypothetical protein